MSNLQVKYGMQLLGGRHHVSSRLGKTAADHATKNEHIELAAIFS